MNNEDFLTHPERRLPSFLNIPLAKRQKLFLATKKKYPDRVLVVVSARRKMDPPILHHKFLVPHDRIVAAFMFDLRKMMLEEGTATNAFFLAVPANGAMGVLRTHWVTPNWTATMAEVAAQHASEDGFVYLVYSRENTFG